MKVFFLKDSEINDWLISGFAQRNFSINFIGIKNSSQKRSSFRLTRILSLHTRYLNLSLKVLRQSKKNDIIICWLDVVGLYVFLLSKFTGKKRNLVPINIMFNDEKDIITTMKRFLFRAMLINSTTYPTVNSDELSLVYKKIFDLPDKDFIVLHDCYGNLEKYKRTFSKGNGTVFCGGTNGRDWDTLVQTAKLLPDVKFVVVGPSKNILGHPIPRNIEYYYDITYLKFQQLMENSSVLALPLNTEAPAGLIVLFTAGLMSKAVITTNNVIMREFIQTDNNGILIEMGDFANFAKQITQLLSDNEKQKKFGEKLNSQIEKLGAPLVFVDGVINITTIINQNKTLYL